MSQHPLPVSPLQRLWLKEMGVGRWQLPEPVVVAPPAAPVSAPARAVPVVAEGNDVADAAAAALAAVRQPVARAATQTRLPERPGVPPTPAVVEPPVATPQPMAFVPAADIEGLRAQVLACTGCELCQTRKQAVFGEGVVPSRWLVVGEAPGEQEDRQGLPFVGRAGQLLDAMFHAVGLARGRDVFIANVIKCRPPANRNPRPEEIAACSPYLRRQIELVQPAGILVLGRFAAHTLLQTDAPINALRGKVHAWQQASGQSVPVVVSYHPAYLLRSPHAKAAAWQDLQLALAQV